MTLLDDLIIEKKNALQAIEKIGKKKRDFKNGKLSEEKYKDKSYWHRLKIALKRNHDSIEVLSRDIKEEQKRINLENSLRIERAFMKVVKNKVCFATYIKYIEEAEKLIENKLLKGEVL